MAGKKKLTVEIAGDTKGLSNAVDDADGKLSKLGDGIAGFAKTAGIAAVAGIGALTAGLGAAAKAAAEDEEAQRLLAQTLKVAGAATDEQIVGTEKWINKVQNATGVLDDELRPALANLVRGTGDVDRATELMTLAMDISAGTGKDLGSVTDALSKAYNGNMKALKALDPSLTGLIKDGATADEVFGELSKTFEGQMSTSAQTTSGQLRIAKARFADLQEEIGAKVLPVVVKLAGFANDKLLPALSVLSKHLIEKLGPIARDVFEWIGVHVPPILAAIAVFVREDVIPALQRLGGWVRENLLPALQEMAASFEENIWPILRDKVIPILREVGRILVEYVVPILGKLIVFIIGDVVPAIFQINAVVAKVIEKIIEAGVKVVEWGGVIAGTIMSVIGFFKELYFQGVSLVSDLVSVIGNIAGAIAAPFKAAFNFIADAWNNSVGSLSFSIPGWVPGIGGKGWDVPNMPYFHAGGTFRAPTPGGEGLAMLRDGERISPPGVGGGGGTFIVQGSIISERDLIGILLEAKRKGFTF